MRYLLCTMMLLAALHGQSAAADGPLEMVVPEGWTLEYKGENGVDFYSLTPPSAGSGLLMFFKWPAPTQPREIPMLVKKLADGFVKASAKGGKYKLTNKKYEIEKLSGEHCVGNHTAFWIKSGKDDMLQGIFMVSVDGQVWNGQFTGQSEHWLTSLKLLKTLKKKG